MSWWNRKKIVPEIGIPKPISNPINFKDLLDTPNSYLGKARKSVMVKIDEMGLEFGDVSIESAKKYGFVADYIGNPLYDGNDGSRVTCTDNTQAMIDMLDELIEKKFLKVYFPAGHYGIKTGNIEKDLTGCTLIIIGDGMDSSIIDFVKEDNTKTSYVYPSQAHWIAKLNNADSIIFKDIWVKGTTNYNDVIGGQNDINACYYGAVWGIVFDKFKLLKLERTRISRFNYRGFTTQTTGAVTYNEMSDKVLCIDCEFDNNKSTGMWITDVKEVEVIGGDYHHNGQRGITGTGYGITCSSRVGNFIIRGGARFHHNYRKGFDTHGCINVFVDDVICEDNVIYHFAIMGWNTITPQGNISINNLTMSNGFTSESKAWLDDCYNAIAHLTGTSQRTGYLFSIDERTQAGATPTNRIKSVKFKNVNVLSNYNGWDKNPNLTRFLCGGIVAQTCESSFTDCDFDLSGMIVNTNTVYGSILFERLVGKVIDKNFTINVPSALTYGAGKFGSVYTLGLPSLIDWDNVSFKLGNGYLLGNTNAGEMANNGIGDSVVRKIKNCGFEWTEFPPVSPMDNKIFGNILYSDVNLTLNNNFAKIGSKRYHLPNKPLTDFYHVFKQWFGSGVATNTNFMEIILEKTTYAVYEMYLNTANESIIFKNDSATNGALTMVKDGTFFTIVSMSNFTDTDGVERTKIVVKSKAQVFGAGMFYGYIKGFGYQYSWGVNRITPLV